jgi:hypothetical protein
LDGSEEESDDVRGCRQHDVGQELGYIELSPSLLAQEVEGDGSDTSSYLLRHDERSDEQKGRNK